MVLHQLQHAGNAPAAPQQAVQQRVRRGKPCTLMSVGVDHPVNDLRAYRLAQIVGQRGQHQRQRIVHPIAVVRRRVQHHHGMLPHIALSVVFGILLHANEGGKLAKPHIQLLHLAQHTEENAGLGRFEQRLFQFPLHPFPGQSGQLHAPTQRHCLRCHGKSEPGGKLRPTQYAQGVFSKACIVHMTQHAPFQIRLSAEGVEDLPGEHILHHGVNGEVPASGRPLHADKGVYIHGKIPVSPSQRPLPTGHGDVQRVPVQHIDAKAFSHAAAHAQSVQQPFQLPGGQSVDLHINILDLPTQQAIPDAAAHKVGPAALLLHQPRDAPGQLHILFDLGQAAPPPCGFLRSRQDRGTPRPPNDQPS